MKSTWLFILVALVVVLAQVFYFLGVGMVEFKRNLALILTLNAGILVSALILRTFLLFSLILCYLPFTKAGIEYEFGEVTLSPYSAGILLMILVALVRLVARHSNFSLSKSDICLGGICLALLISTFYFAEDIISSGYLAFNYVFIPVGAYFVIRVLINNEEQYDMTIKMFLLSLILFGLWTITVYVLTGRRAMPLNVYPISAATCIVVPLLYMITNTYFPRWFRYGAFLLSLTALVLTFPRVYMLALLISPVIFLFIKRGKAFLVMLTFFTSTILLTGLLLGSAKYLKPRAGYTEGVSQHSPERVASKENWKYSLYGRLASYQMGIDNFLEHPVFGVGLYVGQYNVTQHNFNIEWLEYSGIIGYLLYVLFFLSHTWRAGPAAVDDPATRTNLLILVVAMCNSTSNGMMHGMMPHIIFIIVGFTEARLQILQANYAKANPRLTIREQIHGRLEQKTA